MAYPDDNDIDGLRKHFEVLADALAAPGKAQQPEPPEVAMPVNAPDWLWEAWEAHELEWQGWEQTYAQIHALPVAADYPDEEWVA